jgi:hypothetical protein
MRWVIESMYTMLKVENVCHQWPVQHQRLCRSFLLRPIIHRYSVGQQSLHWNMVITFAMIVMYCDQEWICQCLEYYKRRGAD